MPAALPARRGAGATELTVVGQSSRIIALSSDLSLTELPAAPTEEVMLQIRQRQFTLAMKSGQP